MGDFMDIAGQGIGAGLGMLENQIVGAQEYERTKNLMHIQHQKQRGLNAEGHQMQKDMWDYTNYGNQMEHMKRAGLNPALMYGMKGGGGVTTGSQSGGSQAMGQAPRAKTMGIEGMMAAQQMQLMKAQTRDINASADNKEGGEKENLKLTGNVLKEQVNKLKSEIGKNEAAKNLAVSQKEKMDLETEILEIDKNFLVDNNISTEEWGIIKAGKQLLGGMKEFLEWNSEGSEMVWNPELKIWELKTK